MMLESERIVAEGRDEALDVLRKFADQVERQGNFVLAQRLRNFADILNAEIP